MTIAGRWGDHACMTPRSQRLALPAAILLSVGLIAPAQAAVTISSGQYIYGDAAIDDIVPSCIAGNLSTNGVTGSPCIGLENIYIYPNANDDTVDLSGITAASFPSLAHVDTDVEEGPSESGADTVLGSPVDDVITGDGTDTLSGNAGNDLIKGGKIVSGGLGDDVINEYFGSFTANAGPGDDRFVQTLAQGGIDGGSGTDSWEIDFNASAPSYPAELSLVLGADTLNVTLGATSFAILATSVEHLDFTLTIGSAPQNFDGAAMAATQRVLGLGGVDRIVGGGLDDELLGGAGNDALTGGGGSDRLDGGEGDDTVNARDGVADRIDCGGGTDSVVADAVDVVVNCESVDQPALPAPVTPPAPAPVVVTVPGPTQLVPVVPVTGAVSGPAKVKKGKSGSFAFSSTTAGATFQCQVDAGAWKTCASTYKVSAKKLKVGKHKLFVRALVSGAADATPSVRSFKVVKG